MCNTLSQRMLSSRNPIGKSEEPLKVVLFGTLILYQRGFVLIPPKRPSRSVFSSFSTGVLFLQFGDETRRVHITHELSSMETLHALIVHMFPQKLTASMLKSPNTAILIKDEARNVFYELEDVRDIQDRSIIKIYRKEPVYGSYTAAAHLANGDLRVSVRVCLLFSWRPVMPTTHVLKVCHLEPNAKPKPHNKHRC